MLINDIEIIITKDTNLKDAVTVDLDAAADFDTVRNTTYQTLMDAQNNNVSSLVFGVTSSGGGAVSFEVCAKLMAQEAFRYIREEQNKTLKKIEFIVSSDEALVAFEKNIYGYLGYINKKLSQGPFLTVDGIIEYEGGIVLIERSNPPFGWAIPGGFVDYGESVESAVVREMKEETSLDFVDYSVFKVCSEPHRDPRFHTVAVVFIGKGKGILRAADDAQNARVVTADTLPDDMAFDHKEIVTAYFNSR